MPACTTYGMHDIWHAQHSMHGCMHGPCNDACTAITQSTSCTGMRYACVHVCTQTHCMAEGGRNNNISSRHNMRGACMPSCELGCEHACIDKIRSITANVHISLHSHLNLPFFATLRGGSLRIAGCRHSASNSCCVLKSHAC